MLDLHHVLVKKQEHECARLDEFGFRHRARTMRMMAEWAAATLGSADAFDTRGFAAEVAVASDEALLERIGARLAEAGVSKRQLDRRYHKLREEAYRQLVSELGDPSPHQLA